MTGKAGLTTAKRSPREDAVRLDGPAPGLARTPRVAVFSDAIPGRNGVGTYYDDLVEHLEPSLGAVVLVAPQKNGGARGFPWSVPMPGDSTQRLYFPPRHAWRKAVALSPDLVIAATPGPFGALGTAVAMRTGAGLCVGLHTQLDQLAGLYWKRARGRLLRWGLREWDRVMFGRASVVVVHNDALIDTARSRGAPDVRLIGTPTAKAFLSEPVVPLRPKVSSVTFIGRLAPEKQLDQVLESARAFPAVRFRIAGDGPLRKEVDTWACEEPNIESLGWVGREEVIEVLDWADVLVLPSRYETFGTIALEAMARRRLAVVSPESGISRWPELAAGLVVMERGEPLAEALRRVCEMSPGEREERARIGHGAAERLSRQTLAEWVDVVEGAARARLRR